MFYPTIIKALLFVFMLVSVVHAAAPDNQLENCTQKQQLTAAQDMCKSHGAPDLHIACLCDDPKPVCLQANIKGSKVPESCSTKIAAACKASCSSDLLAVKCEGKTASKCVSTDPATKKKLLGQKH